MKNRNLNHADDWATPPAFYEKLNKEFNFDFDPCPWQHDINEWDGLTVPWGKRNYINPPYSRKAKEAFILRAIDEANKGALCVMLLPVSTSTIIFHDHILPAKPKIRFNRGRLPFIGKNQKGQFVNYHLIQKVDFSETLTTTYPNPIDTSEPGIIVEIPKYVKNSGQHDSMIVIFDGRKDEK